MTLLEAVIQKDFLSSNFETTDELLDSCIQTESAANISPNAEMVSVLPWLPLTSSAVALRLMELDASIFYTLQQRLDSQKDKGAGNFIVSIVSLFKESNAKSSRQEKMIRTKQSLVFFREEDCHIDGILCMSFPSMPRDI